MTMHLLPVFVSTTNSRKRKSKMTGKQKLQLAAHQEWVNSMTKGQRADKKVLDKLWRIEYTSNMVVDRSNYVSAGMTSGSASKNDPKVYSGERKLLGIATMHKSNMVPVFAQSDAEDIAKMRRG